MKRLLQLLTILMLVSLLNGCLLIRPYHNQVIATTSTPIYMSLFSVHEGPFISVTCNGRLINDNQLDYILPGPRGYTTLSFPDSSGDMIYQHSFTREVPRSCWRVEGGRYYTDLEFRAPCEPHGDRCGKLFTVDLEGLQCVVSSFLASGTMSSFITDLCYRRDVNTNEPLRKVKLYANRL